VEKRVVQNNGIDVAIIHSDELIITDMQSALDLMATLDYNDNCHRMAINKEAIIEDFFNLSTGIAGDILQKYVTYSKKFAIIGDFSGYTSKALRDFIYECNQGNSVFFVADEQAAILRLTA
jgi:hypothetical protein